MQENLENQENPLIENPTQTLAQPNQPDVPALNAAQEAAAFVASIFEDMHGANAPASADAPSCVEPEAASSPDLAAAPAVVPCQWPTSSDAPTFLHGRHVLIVGLGASGLAMARWCARLGAVLTVADSRAQPPQLAALLHDVPSAAFVHSPTLEPTLLERRVTCPKTPQWHVRGLEPQSTSIAPECTQDEGQDALADAPLAAAHDGSVVELPISAVYRSPGLTLAQTAQLEQAAAARGIVVGGELDLFALALRDLRTGFGYRPHVLAVTGTNGKTTTTTLVEHVLLHAGVDAVAAGNIGPTLLDTLARCINAGTLPAAWVLELSSFQLHHSRHFEPDAAVVLNVTQDHLDWHRDMHDYAQAKARIFGTGTLAVLNRDDPLVAAMRTAMPAPPTPSPTSRKNAPAAQPRWVSFGSNVPEQAGHWGMEVVHGMTWLVRAHDSDLPTHARRTALAPSAEPLHIQRLMPAEALRIQGRHNASNALAALALAHSTGASLASLLHGLRTYGGQPHRVQPIGIVDGVEFFDDSKGTNVGATVAALTGLGEQRRIVLIAGGLGKGQDFGPLVAPVAMYARAVVCIGQDGPAIAQALADCAVPVLHAATMDEAVQTAAARAHAGDAVLLSPACASMDMFRDYAHRAEVFIAAVRELAQSHGQMLDV